MAEYTRYRNDPASEARRGRQRRQTQKQRGKRKYLWLKVVGLLILLAVIAGLCVAAGAIFAISRDLPSLDQLEKRRNAVNTTIYDRHGELIAELHGAENRVVVPSAEIPKVMKDATVAVEDERFYQHHGVDFKSVMRAMVLNVRAGTRRPGRVHHHRAVRQERLRRQRAHLHAQAARGRAGLAAGGQVDQGPHPHRLPQHRVLRRRRLRRRGGRAHLLPQAREGPEPPGLRPARGAPQVPHPVRPHHRPQAGQGAPQHRAAAHGRPGLHHAGARRQDEQEGDRRLQAPARTPTTASPTTSPTT